MKIAFYIAGTKDGNSTPCLGVLYIIAVLNKSGYDAWLFDQRFDADALRKLTEWKPDVVGFSAVTSSYNASLKAAGYVKGLFPDTVIVFGGPHPSVLPSEVLCEKNVDYVMIGESEKSFPELLRALENKSSMPERLKNVKNLVYRENGEIKQNDLEGFLSSEDLNQLPFPAFDKMELELYFKGGQTHGIFQKGSRILPIMTSRGCPNNCTYCCRVMGKKIRYRSVESVMEEFKYLVSRYNVDEIFIEDDNFTVNRDRALEILSRISELPARPHLKFANGIRADRIDEALLKAMKNAGIYSISFGIESGCRKTLLSMKKNLDLDLAREAVLLAKSHGLLVGSNCIIGYPDETVSDIRESIDFFLSLPLDSMAIVNLVPFPGTEVRRICEEKAYLMDGARDWDNYYFSINNPLPLIETPSLPFDKLCAETRRAYRKMYMRPSWIIRNIGNLSLRQMLQGAFLMLRGTKH